MLSVSPSFEGQTSATTCKAAEDAFVQTEQEANSFKRRSKMPVWRMQASDKLNQQQLDALVTDHAAIVASAHEYAVSTPGAQYRAQCDIKQSTYNRNDPSPLALGSWSSRTVLDNDITSNDASLHCLRTPPTLPQRRSSSEDLRNVAEFERSIYWDRDGVLRSREIEGDVYEERWYSEVYWMLIQWWEDQHRPGRWLERALR